MSILIAYRTRYGTTERYARLLAERAMAQLDSAFPDWLSLHAFGRWALGGEVRLDRLNLLDRFLVRRLIRVERDIAKMRPEAVEPIARRVAELTQAGEASP